MASYESIDIPNVLPIETQSLSDEITNRTLTIAGLALFNSSCRELILNETGDFKPVKQIYEEFVCIPTLNREKSIYKIDIKNNIYKRLPRHFGESRGIQNVSVGTHLNSCITNYNTYNKTGDKISADFYMCGSVNSKKINIEYTILKSFLLNLKREKQEFTAEKLKKCGELEQKHEELLSERLYIEETHAINPYNPELNEIEDEYNKSGCIYNNISDTTLEFLMDLIDYTNIDVETFKHIMNGAFVIIKGDNSEFYRKYKQIKISERCITREVLLPGSSHDSTKQQFRLGTDSVCMFRLDDIKNVLHSDYYDILIGTSVIPKLTDYTFFQFEYARLKESSTGLLRNSAFYNKFILHARSYLEYSRYGENVGPFGRSPYAEYSSNSPLILTMYTDKFNFKVSPKIIPILNERYVRPIDYTSLYWSKNLKPKVLKPAYKMFLQIMMKTQSKKEARFQTLSAIPGLKYVFPKYTNQNDINVYDAIVTNKELKDYLDSGKDFFVHQIYKTNVLEHVISQNICNIDYESMFGYEKNAAVLLDILNCAYENGLLDFNVFGGKKNNKKTKQIKRKNRKTKKRRNNVL